MTASATSSRWVRCRPRAAVRDVGRVLQMPLGLVDRIAKMIPNPPGKTVSFARGGGGRAAPAADRRTGTERAKDLFAIVEKIEGFYRHASTHPAGVVIGDRPLDEIVPLYRDPRSEMPVTQFDYEDAEKAGPGEVRLSGPENPHRHRQGGRVA